MAQAKSGDTVRIHYTGTLTDGTEFDSSAGRDPLEFALGSGQVIAGFDSAVDGMTVGEQKSVTIPPRPMASDTSSWFRKCRKMHCRRRFNRRSACSCRARVPRARS